MALEQQHMELGSDFSSFISRREVTKLFTEATFHTYSHTKHAATQSPDDLEYVTRKKQSCHTTTDL